ncbi:sel1 repeat family protein [Acidithiobacillus sp. MC6.1]|nr:sel1 repeat family protein [Acidithiobacillus sp. MC6.1]
MNTPNHPSLFISTPAAARLTGKTPRTITNWLETGTAKGTLLQANNLPQGQSWKVDLLSIAEHIPMQITDEILDSIRKSEDGDAKETTRVGLFLYMAGAKNLAVNWFEAAAKKGDVEAMEWLWDSYYYGRGVEINLPVAFQWLGKAAEYGSLTCTTLLNNIHKINEMLEARDKDAKQAISNDIKELINRSESAQRKSNEAGV